MDAFGTPGTLQTQTFIRSLKATEKSYSDGSQKIVWAVQIWEADTPELPKKDEIIAEWILSSMLMSKADDDKYVFIFFLHNRMK